MSEPAENPEDVEEPEVEVSAPSSSSFREKRFSGQCPFKDCEVVGPDEAWIQTHVNSAHNGTNQKDITRKSYGPPNVRRPPPPREPSLEQMRQRAKEKGQAEKKAGVRQKRLKAEVKVSRAKTAPQGASSSGTARRAEGRTIKPSAEIRGVADHDFLLRQALQEPIIVPKGAVVKMNPDGSVTITAPNNAALEDLAKIDPFPPPPRDEVKTAVQPAKPFSLKIGEQSLPLEVCQECQAALREEIIRSLETPGHDGAFELCKVCKGRLFATLRHRFLRKALGA
jgi:hypothetical protein